jgi:excisionase family DNA binding protein
MRMVAKTNGHDTQPGNVTPSTITAGDGLDLLTTEDLAQSWKISKAEVRRLTQHHGLPYFQIGRYIRFDEHDASNWRNAQKKVSSRKRP